MLSWLKYDTTVWDDAKTRAPALEWFSDGPGRSRLTHSLPFPDGEGSVAELLERRIWNQLLGYACK